MKKNHSHLKHLQYFLATAFFVLQGCGSSTERVTDTGLKYFPLHTGNTWVYDVSEITYDTLIQNIVDEYQEKYEIVDTYKSQINEDVYVIHVSKRSDTAADWEPTKTWTAKVSSINEIIVTEENIPFIKMILPVKDGVQWKGNKYNTIEADRNNGRVDTFMYLELKKPFGEFPNTITVQESNDLNFAYKDVRYSVYADSVGLVYRVNNYIEYCDEVDCFGFYVRKRERTKIQTLVENDIQ